MDPEDSATPRATAWVEAQSLLEASSSLAPLPTFTLPLRSQPFDSSRAEFDSPNASEAETEILERNAVGRDTTNAEVENAELLALHREWPVRPMLEVVQKPDEWQVEDPGPFFRVSASVSIFSKHPGDGDAVTSQSARREVPMRPAHWERLTLAISIVCTPLTLQFHIPAPSPTESLPFIVDPYIQFLHPADGISVEAQVQALDLIMYFAQKQHSRGSFDDEAELSEWGYRTLRLLKREAEQGETKGRLTSDGRSE